MKSKLAIDGGNKVIDFKFKRYNPIGDEEKNAVLEVMDSGILSEFLGVWDKDKFYGGKNIINFEENIKNHFNVEHAITVNSWTSGLIAAIGAIGIEPGDEVIVPPWTMSATAIAILWWQAIPVFVDIEDQTFCIDPNKIIEKITNYTKAIITVDIYGQSADVDKINSIANKYNLKVISDSAQSPNAKYNGRYAGTLTDIGGFSLNYHKHIHTGEGGIIVTNNAEYAERLRLIRNHGENIVGPANITNINNIIGGNFRMGEIEAAIGHEQLKKLDAITEKMNNVGSNLTAILKNYEGIHTPHVRKNCTHVYYSYPIKLDFNKINVSRKRLCEILRAEGVRLERVM